MKIEVGIFMVTWNRSYEDPIYVHRKSLRPTRRWPELDPYFEAAEGFLERVPTEPRQRRGIRHRWARYIDHSPLSAPDANGVFYASLALSSSRE